MKALFSQLLRMVKISETDRAQRINQGWQAYLQGDINKAFNILQAISGSGKQSEGFNREQSKTRLSTKVATFFRDYPHPKLSGISQENRHQFAMAIAQSWLFTEFNVFGNDRLIETLPLATLLGTPYAFDLDIESMNMAVYGELHNRTEGMFEYALPVPYAYHQETWPELAQLQKVSVSSRQVFIRIIQYSQIRTGLSEYDRLSSEEMPELGSAISELANVGLVDPDLGLADLLMTQSIAELKKFAFEYGISVHGVKQKVCQTISQELDAQIIKKYLHSKSIDNKYLRPTISNLPTLKKYIWAEIYRLKVYVQWLENVECMGKKAPIRHIQEETISTKTQHMAPNAYEANIFSPTGIGYKQKNPEAARLIEQIWNKKCDETVAYLTEKHGWYSPRYIGHQILDELSPETRDAFEKQFWGKVGQHPYWAIVYYSIYKIHELKLIRRQPRKLNCAGCSRKFNEWSISENISIRVGHRIHFCSDCYGTVCWPEPTKKKHIFKTKQKLAEELAELVTSLEFIPSKSFINKPQLNEYSDEKQIRIVRSLLKMADLTVYEKTFGSWLQALIASGVLDKGVQATARGYRCVANDGHICLSLPEKNIDDWLSARNIPHTKEPVYPYDYYLNSSGLQRADWLVRDTYIEYAGLMSDPEYAAKMKGKQELAQKFNLDLIIIEPQDLFSLENKLGRLHA